MKQKKNAKLINNEVPTYISLFSSAGIGCYGFKLEGFECIATNELLSRRLDIQKFNKKCKYDTGYIGGDIRQDTTKSLIWNEIDRWKLNENVNRVDVIVATPPCQGMSVANHKKASDEIVRNSLVVESIKMVKEIDPKFFIFENVSSFMKTLCTDVDGKDKPISEAISNNLGQGYSIVSSVINFMNFGACSSRQRTLVIGVAKDVADDVSPYELFPMIKPTRTLREVIGKLQSIDNMGDIDQNDIYHFFRPYPKHMREWICDLKEGQSAFENKDVEKIPHRIVDGQRVFNLQKNGDKYKRQCWDKVGPCIHTRNDQLASQNTIHPEDDRVFSIRELMLMMTVPNEFKWTALSNEQLNSLPISEKKAYLEKNEFNIRQSLGEAVPTAIFQEIAARIKDSINTNTLSKGLLSELNFKYDFSDTDILLDFIENNPYKLSFSSLSKLAEMANTKRTDHAAYFTSKRLITEILISLPSFESKSLRILEPSVGVGNFIPLLLKKFQDKRLDLYLVDIDKKSLNILDKLLEKIEIPPNCSIKLIESDFLKVNIDFIFDLVIGNPPFYKIKSDDFDSLKSYRSNVINKQTRNICSFFLEKAIRMSKYTAFVFPKYLLNTPEFSKSRDYLSNFAFESIIDFGEEGFPGVLIETIAVLINTTKKPNYTRVKSLALNFEHKRKQSYIFSKDLPYWIIYRDEQFDQILGKLKLGVFSVFRDRQITNSILRSCGDIRVLKSRNISIDGTGIIHLSGYDSYVNKMDVSSLAIYKYLDNDKVYLAPNMSYYPRVIKKPKNCLVNGSVAILTPLLDVQITDEQLKYFSSDEYRAFYRVARNYQTRSLNIDSFSVYFFGLLRIGEEYDLV